jgi:hypothetical protein
VKQCFVKTPGHQQVSQKIFLENQVGWVDGWVDGYIDVDKDMQMRERERHTHTRIMM